MTSRIPAIVVGGGVSGLVCAYALRKAGVEALLVEASWRAGGVIRSERREGYLLELGPQSFSGTVALRKLCAELGIEEQFVEAPARAPRYVLVDGKLAAVTMSPPALLSSSLLGRGTKWNIARDAFGRSQAPEEAAGSVIRGMIGAATNRKGSRERPTLLSFREGNETLVRALAAKIGSGLRLNAEVATIAVARDGAGGKFEVRLRATGGEEKLLAAQLVLATATDVAGRLLKEVNADFETLLGGIEYAPVAVVSLGYRRADVGHSLGGFGFLVPRSSGLRVQGTVWNSSLFPGRAPEG